MLWRIEIPFVFPTSLQIPGHKADVKQIGTRNDKERINLDEEEEFFKRLNNKKKDEIFAMKDDTINIEETNEENKEDNDSFTQNDTEDIVRPRKKGKHF